MQNTVLKHFALICLLGYLFIGLFPQSAVAAQQTLRVSPVIIHVSLSPNKTYTHEVTVENLTNAPMPLRATLNDFMTTDEEGGYVFEETAENPLLSWITLSETELILKPKEKKKIMMTIKTPTGISLGGYYGILFFEPVPQTNQQEATTVNSKVGILMLANVGVPDPNAQKAEILASDMPLLDTDGTIPLTLRVKNISLNFFTAKPIITLTSVLPQTPLTPQQSLTLEDKIIFPGKIRRWTETSAVQNLSPNIYRLRLAVSTGSGNSVTTEKLLVVFPLEKALIILIICSGIAFIVVKRKRLVRALKEFVK